MRERDARCASELRERIRDTRYENVMVAIEIVDLTSHSSIPGLCADG